MVTQVDTSADLTGEQVRQLRQTRGWSQGRLAEESGVSLRTISNFERGAHELHASNRRRLLDALTAGGDPDSTRSKWSEHTRLALDIIGAYLDALPDDERLTEITNMLADIGNRRRDQS